MNTKRRQIMWNSKYNIMSVFAVEISREFTVLKFVYIVPCKQSWWCKHPSLKQQSSRRSVSWIQFRPWTPSSLLECSSLTGW